MTFQWYKGSCPNCSNADLQQHSKSVWCLKCGWARNRYHDPATGKPVAVYGLLGKEQA